jgi:hypothetical protein
MIVVLLCQVEENDSVAFHSHNSLHLKVLKKLPRVAQQIDAESMTLSP